MKTMKIFSVIALLMMGAFTFTSCSDDDDNNGTAYNLALMDEDDVRKAILGTWAITDPYTHFGPVKTGIIAFDEHGVGTYAETKNDLYWSLNKYEDGHFEFRVNRIYGDDRYQISFLSTTTFILTYETYDGLEYEKGTVTFKRIK